MEAFSPLQESFGLAEPLPCTESSIYGDVIPTKVGLYTSADIFAVIYRARKR